VISLATARVQASGIAEVFARPEEPKHEGAKKHKATKNFEEKKRWLAVGKSFR
jgi:hypothetical protein